MELERIDDSKGEMPADLSAHFQGKATIQQTGPGSIDWDVDERDWGSDYG